MPGFSPKLQKDALHWVKRGPIIKKGLSRSQGTWVDPSVCSPGIESQGGPGLAAGDLLRYIVMALVHPLI